AKKVYNDKQRKGKIKEDIETSA
ncbi:MAG: hypothetical protein K0Q87_1738, partial [Neobacillus sp.]|nr:hypothetical protein [Neobacillus sp.]